MSNIKELQSTTDNANRHTGTIAKKVRARLKTEIPQMVENLIDLALGTNEGQKLTAAQRATFLAKLVQMGVDVEKTVDKLNIEKKEAREEGNGLSDHIPRLAPIIKMKAK